MLKRKSSTFIVKRKYEIRVVAMLLSLLVLLASVPIVTVAEGNVATSSETVTESAPAMNETEIPNQGITMVEGDLPLSLLENMRVELVPLPETISYAQALEGGHVHRLYSQEENLNTARFQNQNGTKTAYVFDQPIKYVGADGEIYDKNTEIEPTGLAGYSYAMTDNSFNVHFGSTSANGIFLRYGEYSFTMYPESSLLISTPTLSNDARSIVYQNAFGSGTALRYTTQLSGLKEDIVLLSDVGKYSFRFLLQTSDLTPSVDENGRWSLLDENGIVVIRFADILIGDSAGKQTFGELSIVSRPAGGYIMTVNAPRAFLQESDTVYPVFIDPTVTVYETNSYVENNEIVASYTAIEDFGLYSDDELYVSVPGGQHAFGDSAMVAYRFSDFYANNSTYQGAFVDLTSHEIGKATLCLRNLSDISNTTFRVHLLEETVLYWDMECFLDYNYNSYYDLWDSVPTNISNVSANSTIEIDFTQYARRWADFNSGVNTDPDGNPMLGIAVVRDGWPHIYVNATEAAGTSNVYYRVDYASSECFDDFYIVHNGRGYAMTVENSTINNVQVPTLSTTPIGQASATWRIQYEGGDALNCTISLYKNGAYQYLCRTNTPGEVCLKPIGEQGVTTEYIWSVTSLSTVSLGLGRKMLKGHLRFYSFFLNYRNVSTVEAVEYDYTVENASSIVQNPSLQEECLWYMCKPSNFSYITRISDTMWFPDVMEVDLSPSMFSPSYASWTSNQFFDFSLVDESMGILTDGVNEKSLLLHRNRGDAYIDIIADHKPTGQRYSFTVTFGQIVPDGTYFIRNVGSNQFMVSGTGNSIQQNTYSGSEEWELTYHEEQIEIEGSSELQKDCYYTICENSYNMGGYLSVDDSGLIVLKSNLTDSGKWMVTVTGQGNYRITPKINPQKAMAVPSNESGAYLQQSTYTNNASCFDEWIISYDAAFFAQREDFDHLPEPVSRAGYINSADVYSSRATGRRNFYTKHDEVFYPTEMRLIMQNSKVVIVHGHGRKDSFLLEILDENNDPEISSNDPETPADENNDREPMRFTIDDILNTDMSNVNLVIYLTCNGAKDYSENNIPADDDPETQENESARIPANIVEASRAAGAKAVIGFDQITEIRVCNLWTSELFKLLDSYEENPLTLSEALEKISDADSYDDYNYEYTDPEDGIRYERNLNDVCVVSIEAGYDPTLEELFS